MLADHLATYGGWVRMKGGRGPDLKPWGQVWAGEAPTPLPRSMAPVPRGGRSTDAEDVPRSSVRTACVPLCRASSA